jgi:hypothetical protein
MCMALCRTAGCGLRLPEDVACGVVGVPCRMERAAVARIIYARYYCVGGIGRPISA